MGRFWPESFLSEPETTFECFCNVLYNRFHNRSVMQHDLCFCTVIQHESVIQQSVCFCSVLLFLRTHSFFNIVPKMSTRSSARDRQSTQDQNYEYDENAHIDPEPADSQIVEVGAEVLTRRSNVK